MTENGTTILVCQGTGCVSSESPQILEALKQAVERYGFSDSVKVSFTGCHGFCQQGPIVIVEPEGVFYSHVKKEDAWEIIDEHVSKGQHVDRLFYRDPVSGEPIPLYKDIPFYKHQNRIILRNCGHINPEKIEDYITTGGYQALKKTLNDMTPSEIIEEVLKSGLRGRGGAGFSTGLKWLYCRKAEGSPKYMICNADEGDPGAFMDRSVLEGDPHSVLEGLIIAAYAIGATKGYIYIRAEYPLAVKRFRMAMHSARELGLLGENILNSNFSFDLEIVEGAGAFVCGEETALMASIMGLRGIPRPRPPFPAVSGVWGKPTTINNVKTLASIPAIVNNGATWFSSIGTANSKGTAVFALTGNIANSGLVEVPIGTPLRKIIYDIGGGIPGGKDFKAVQTGGPSGGCIPKDMLDLPADYEALTEAGSIMGSGGMVVMDEDTCMVDIAHFFLAFTQAESCGKCTPCREGTRVMLDMLSDITQGKGTMELLDTLEEIGKVVKDTSLCGLGQTAPNPILTTIRYFRDEYIAHVRDRICPAKVCKSLFKYWIDPEKCVGCQLCFKNCPVGAITGELKQVHTIDQDTCIRCGMCNTVCPEKIQAVQKVDSLPIRV